MSTDNPSTLRELMEQHPEWGDMEIVIYRPQDGEYDWLDGAAMVYPHQIDLDETVLVFAPN